MRAYLLALLLIALCGCAAPVTPLHKSNPEEIALAKKHLLTCVRSVLPQLDDGVSPANIIASATASLCREETDALIAAVNRDTKDRDVIRGVTNHLRSGKNIIPVVLQYRAQNKK